MLIVSYVWRGECWHIVMSCFEYICSVSFQLRLSSLRFDQVRSVFTEFIILCTYSFGSVRKWSCVWISKHTLMFPEWTNSIIRFEVVFYCVKSYWYLVIAYHGKILTHWAFTDIVHYIADIVALSSGVPCLHHTFSIRLSRSVVCQHHVVRFWISDYRVLFISWEFEYLSSITTILIL